MTDNKLTDEQIIKALECCINDDCDNCPDTFGNCEHNAMRNSLDLINRQKAEIINRTEEYNDMLEQRNRCEEGIKFRELEIKIFEMERNELHKIVAEQKAEIERLQAEIKKLKNEMSYMSSPNTIGDNHEMGCW